MRSAVMKETSYGRSIRRSKMRLVGGQNRLLTINRKDFENFKINRNAIMKQ